MATAHEPYVKAAGSDHMARYYDLMARLAMRERTIKRRVIDLAQLGPGKRLLDVGCGTGTLLLMARRDHPEATLIGVDGDPVILGIARQKARRAGVAIEFDEGMAYALPYTDGAFDAVVSTLAFHHLTPDQQQRALAEVRRVLRPDGRLVIGDFAPPHNALMRVAQQLQSAVMRRHGAGRPHGPRHGQEPAHTHGVEAAAETARHRPLPVDLLRSNGWTLAAPVERYMSVIGTVAIYALKRPE